MSEVIPFPTEKHVMFRRATDGYLLTVVEGGRHLKFTHSPSTDHAVQFTLAPKTYPNDGPYTIRSRLTNNFLFRDRSSDQIRADVVENAIVLLDRKFDFERPKDQTLQPNHILLKNVGNNCYCGSLASSNAKDCLFANLPAGNAVLVVVEDVQEVIFQRLSDGHLLTVIEKGQYLMFLDGPRNDIAVQFMLQPSLDFAKLNESTPFTIRSLLTNNLLVPEELGRIKADGLNINDPDEAKFALERTGELIIPPTHFLLKHVSNNGNCGTPGVGPEKDCLYANAPEAVKLAVLILPESN